MIAKNARLTARQRQVVGLFLAVALPGVLAGREPQLARAAGGDQKEVSTGRAKKIATEAYVWGYALVVTQREYPAISERDKVAINEWYKPKEFPTPKSKAVVSPNVDTLYLLAMMDLSAEPLVLHVPDTSGRYYTLQFMDAYSNDFAYVGTRVTGTKAGNYLISAPGWKGEVPAAMAKVIKSPTPDLNIIGRIGVAGEADLANARTLQEQFTLTPLSTYLGGPKTTARYWPKAPGTPQEVAKAGIEFFDELCAAVAKNPPPADQDKLLKRFAEVGIIPGTRPSKDVKDPALRKALADAIPAGEWLITAKLLRLGTNVNGWLVSMQTGDYGTDYVLRAAMAKIAWGVNVPAEALYPMARTDNSRAKLTGANRYVVHFDPGQTPPVEAFWSLTVYNAQRFLVDNPIKRYALGSLSKELKYNDDGSLDIYIQRQNPPGKESNWLPAPEGDFNLILRLYLPKPEVLEGKYKYPPIKRLR